LQAAGFKVILTRAQDTYVELPDRPALANRRGADLFISLHFNSSPTSPDSVQGLETYCITPAGAASSNDSGGEGADQGACTANRVEDKSLLLAYQVQRALVKNLGATDRDVRRARFEVLRTAQMPAILVEGGYMSHPVEGKKIFDAGYRKQMAAAMVKGILNYQKITMPAVAPAIMNSAN
jgi:N-acetylmuramoyl-L-alanine amidase